MLRVSGDFEALLACQSAETTTLCAGDPGLGSGVMLTLTAGPGTSDVTISHATFLLLDTEVRLEFVDWADVGS